jgi:error-prone DNA polymerase
MEMAVAVAGFSPAEADELRQAMAAKRSEVRMARLKGRFYAGMANYDIVGSDADHLWDALSAFANFGFPESHSVSFAHLVYCSAWLKVHYPAAFLASLLNAQPLGFWSPQSLVADAQRHGVTVLRPDVQSSRATSTLEHHESGTAVRLGLTTVRGVREPAAQRIIDGAPWVTMEDLARRAELRQSHLEALAAAGALDSLGRSRRGLLWEAGAASQNTKDRLPGMVTGTTAPALRPTSEFERVADDMWALGLTPDATAIALCREELNQLDVTMAGSLASVEAHRVVVCGVVTHRQHPETAHGAVFLNLEDESGHVNVIFSKGAWVRWESVARSAPVLLIRGALQRGQGAIALQAESVEAFDVSVVTPPSRDFR